MRVTLLPDKKHRLETKIKRRTLNPRWNETFYFEGFPVQKLQSRILHLHVFDYDRFSRDDSIGEVFLPLCQVDFTGKPSFWKALKPPAKDKCGELLCSLCYHPSNSILTLSLVKARNLKAKDINGKSGEASSFNFDLPNLHDWKILMLHQKNLKFRRRISLRVIQSFEASSKCLKASPECFKAPLRFRKSSVECLKAFYNA